MNNKRVFCVACVHPTDTLPEAESCILRFCSFAAAIGGTQVAERGAMPSESIMILIIEKNILPQIIAMQLISDEE